MLLIAFWLYFEMFLRYLRETISLMSKGREDANLLIIIYNVRLCWNSICNITFVTLHDVKRHHPAFTKHDPNSRFVGTRTLSQESWDWPRLQHCSECKSDSLHQATARDAFRLRPLMHVRERLATARMSESGRSVLDQSGKRQSAYVAMPRGWITTENLPY